MTKDENPVRAWLRIYNKNFLDAYDEGKATEERLKDFLLKSLRPNLPGVLLPNGSPDDCDQRPIARQMYSILWEDSISKFRGDTLFSCKGGWRQMFDNNQSNFDGTAEIEIVYRHQAKELGQDYQNYLIKKISSGRASLEWFEGGEDGFPKPDKFSDGQVNTWKKYHCLANFMPLPPILNSWRGYSEAECVCEKNYPKHDWYDRIVEFLQWVQHGYLGKADVAFEKGYQKVFDDYWDIYFSAFGGGEEGSVCYLKANYLSSFEVKIIESSLFKTMDKFLDDRAKMMADRLLELLRE
jgi:hypothetical protein